MIHFIKSDNQFQFILQNLIAQTPSNPLLNLPFKGIV